MSKTQYECRIIRGHRVFGRAIVIEAPDELTAKLISTRGNTTESYAWEAKELTPGVYEVFVAKHTDAFAMSD